MKATGQTTVQDLTLESPALEIVATRYDWKANTIYVDIELQEEGATHKHGRTYVFDNSSGKNHTKADIRGLIASHEELKAFK